MNPLTTVCILRSHNDDIANPSTKMTPSKERKLICVITALSVALSLCVDTRAQSSAQNLQECIGIDSICYYYYDDPWDDKRHDDDNIIELKFKNGDVCDGYFWGTSDEFVTAREGYYAGHFVLRMQQVNVQGGSLCFVLDSRGMQYLSAPVDVAFHSADEALAHGAYLWMQESEYFQDSIPYKAEFVDDILILTNLSQRSCSPQKRNFVRMSLEDIQMINRKVLWEEENSVLLYERDSLIHRYDRNNF